MVYREFSVFIFSLILESLDIEHIHIYIYVCGHLIISYTS